METDSIYHNFVQALAFINTVMEVHADTPPFDELTSACEATDSCEEFGVAIYEVDPDSPCDHFTIRLQCGKFVLTQHGFPHSDPDWNVSARHLRNIARNPLRYIKQPSQLDLEWLFRRCRQVPE